MNKCAKAVMIAGGIYAVAELSFIFGKAWGLSTLNMKWPNAYNELTKMMAKVTEDPSRSAADRAHLILLLTATKLCAMVD